MTAAHRTLPMNTRVRVTNKKNGRSVELRINDHLSVQGDVGLEYFFSIDTEALVDGKHPERTVFVPTLGVIGRL